MLNLITLANRFKGVLFELNMALAESGRPFFHLGGTNFNKAYRLYPEPRVIPSWRFPFVRPVLIYLTYFDGANEYQIDLVYDVDKKEIIKAVRSNLEKNEN